MYDVSGIINGVWSINPASVASIESLRTRMMSMDRGEQTRLTAKCLAQDGAGTWMVYHAEDGRWKCAEGTDKDRKPERLTAVMSLSGVMIPRGPGWIENYGYVVVDRWVERFNALVSDDRVGAIVIDVDSPGGSAYGVTEAARAVFAARGSKPIVSVANPMSASAGYYIAAAADEIVVTPSGEVGSVGTVVLHLDTSKADEQAGLKWTIIKEGKFKWEATGFEPLSDEARSFIEKRVHDYYAMFVGDLRKFRRGANTKAPSDFGGGRMYGAADAVEMGLADRIGTLAETASKLGAKINSSGRRAAARAALSRI